MNDKGSNSDFLSCSTGIESSDNKEELTPYYNVSCPVCKLFGNQFSKGRIYFGDAYLNEESKAAMPDELPTRDGAPINRFVGNNNNLFSYEYIVNRTFETTIRIENFELWQLGLLAYLFRDLYQEEIRIGFGSARGLGKVKGIINGLEITYFDPTIEVSEDDKVKLYGVGALDDSSKYDYVTEENIAIKLDNDLTVKESIFPSYQLTAREDNYKASTVWQFLSQVAQEFSLEEIKNVQTVI